MNEAKPFCISKQEVWEAYQRVKSNSERYVKYGSSFSWIGGERPVDVSSCQEASCDNR